LDEENQTFTSKKSQNTHDGKLERKRKRGVALKTMEGRIKDSKSKILGFKNQ